MSAVYNICRQAILRKEYLAAFLKAAFGAVSVDQGTETEHQEIGTIHPNMTGSVGAEWYHLRSGEEVLTCLDIYLEESATISFPDLSSDWMPFLWLEGQVGLNQTLETTDKIVCLDGADQALPYNAQSYLHNVALGNATFVVGFDSTWPHIVSASGDG